MYCRESSSYSLFLKCAEFQVPSLRSGAERTTLGTPRWPYSVIPNSESNHGDLPYTESP